MSAFYDGLKLTANGLILDKGQACTLGVVTQGTYDADAAASTPSTANTSIVAAIIDYPRKEIDGSLIRQGDKRAIVSAYGISVTPLPSHKFTDAAGVTYTIMDVRSVAPGGTVVLWVMQIRADT
jgi:hypothetical protein